LHRWDQECEHRDWRSCCYAWPQYAVVYCSHCLLNCASRELQVRKLCACCGRWTGGKLIGPCALELTSCRLGLAFFWRQCHLVVSPQQIIHFDSRDHDKRAAPRQSYLKMDNKQRFASTSCIGWRSVSTAATKIVRDKGGRLWSDCQPSSLAPFL
jgi:hypothetical protein